MRKIISVAIILILVMTNLLVYLSLSGDLEQATFEISGLRNDLKELKTNILLYRNEMGEQFEEFVEMVNRVEQDGREESASLKERLLSLQETNDQFIETYVAIQKDIPVKKEIENEVDTPTFKPEEKEHPYLADIKIGTLFVAGKKSFEEGDFKQARLSFLKLVDLDPPLWEAHLYYIRSAYEENPGRAATDKTVKGLLDGLPKDMNETGQISKYKGLLALETRDYDQGISLIKDSLRLNPADKHLRLLLGECYLYLKKPEKANMIFNEILSLFPDTPESGTAKTYLERSRGAG